MASERSYDIREDEDRDVKLQEIVSLLVAAGYFRARIKGLSAFDKVVGGMAWCMEGCSVDVDVNLLFQENSTIGQKIALTEKIVSVLPRMGCPYAISPHQIQGLDFIQVFPVVQWLVRESVTVREERRQFLRQSAVREFDSRYRADNCKTHALETIYNLQDKFRPRRVARRRDAEVQDDEGDLEKVENTLMEYGFLTRTVTNPEIEARDLLTRTAANQEIENIPSEKVGALVEIQSEAIAAAAEQLQQMGLSAACFSHEEEQTEDLVNLRDSLIAQKSELENQLATSTAHLNNTKKLLAEIRVPEPNNNYKTYSKLQDLVLLEEELIQEEKEFREHCRCELVRLQALVEDASGRSVGENAELDAECDRERSRISALRLQIGRRNRALAQLQRRLDEVPGRAELSQYQRRFLELYNLVAQKHTETKHFIALYNTLNDTSSYLSKELSIINSVHDTYTKAMSNSGERNSFIQQLEGIVAAIKGNREKVEAKLKEEQLNNKRLNQQLMELFEQQRNYFHIVRQLQQEVKRNEHLLAQLRAS